MANSAQARKRARQAVVRRTDNASMRSMLRTFIKSASKAIESGDRAAAENAYRRAVPVIDRVADKGIIHKNKAARHKRRLNARLRTLAQS